MKSFPGQDLRRRGFESERWQRENELDLEGSIPPIPTFARRRMNFEELDPHGSRSADASPGRRSTTRHDWTEIGLDVDVLPGLQLDRSPVDVLRLAEPGRRLEE